MPSVGILYDLLENLNQFQVIMDWSFYLGIGDSWNLWPSAYQIQSARPSALSPSPQVVMIELDA